MVGLNTEAFHQQHLVQPLGVWWAHLRCTLYCLFNMEQVLVFSEQQHFSGFPWLPVTYRLLSLESESGVVFYRCKDYDQETTSRLVENLRQGLQKRLAELAKEIS